MTGGEVAVVVGASGALGGAIAERLVAAGLTVVGVARGASGRRPAHAPPFRPAAQRMRQQRAVVRQTAAQQTAAVRSSAVRSSATQSSATQKSAAQKSATQKSATQVRDAEVGATGRSAAADTKGRGGLEWCAADIGSDDAVAAIAAAVGDRPVRMVVQAAGLPAAGPLATIEPDALGRAVALKCGGLLRLVRAVEHNLHPGSRIVALGGHYGIEPAPYACAAGVTNAALANLVRQLATAYGPAA